MPAAYWLGMGATAEIAEGAGMLPEPPEHERELRGPAPIDGYCERGELVPATGTLTYAVVIRSPTRIWSTTSIPSTTRP
ncbi:MAG: hypothetical protein ACJAQ3_003873 [Planctomycetota bacterium]|jgi:hypothetical protein